jgi:hypothetical protein
MRHNDHRRRLLRLEQGVRVRTHLKQLTRYFWIAPGVSTDTGPRGRNASGASVRLGQDRKTMALVIVLGAAIVIWVAVSIWAVQAFT